MLCLGRTQIALIFSRRFWAAYSSEKLTLWTISRVNSSKFRKRNNSSRFLGFFFALLFHRTFGWLASQVLMINFPGQQGLKTR